MGQRADEVKQEGWTGNDTGYSDSDLGDDAAVSSYQASAIVDTGDSEADDETSEIRAEIEQTRVEMSATIDAIQEKLSPQHLMDQAKETVREATVGRVEKMVSEVNDTARGFGGNFMESIKQNPVPAAIAGLSLGWLVMKSLNRNNAPTRRYSYGGYQNRDQDRYPESYGYGGYGYRGLGEQDYRYQDRDRGIGDKAGEMAGQVGSKVGDAAGGVAHAAGNVASGAANVVGSVAGGAADAVGNIASGTAHAVGNVAGGTASLVGNTGEMIGEGAHRAQNQVQRMLLENPLAVGAVALALGAAVGLAVPETQPERRLMGEARDNLVNKAQEMAQDTMQKVGRVAEEVTNTAQNTAREAARDEGLVSS
jgi:hypothetical protein